MPHYYAKFNKDKKLETRIDTRIYFGKKEPNLKNSHCLGLVILKNPGSAKGTDYNDKLEKLTINKDKALPSIANMYQDAMNELNIKINPNGYIRVCNLIPICSADINTAIKSLDTNKYLIEKTNYKQLPFVLYAWGWEIELNCRRELYLKELAKYNSTAFFVQYDFHAKNKYKIMDGQPKFCDKAKHTQGMPQKIVVNKLTELLKKKYK